VSFRCSTLARHIRPKVDQQAKSRVPHQIEREAPLKRVSLARGIHRGGTLAAIALMLVAGCGGSAPQAADYAMQGPSPSPPPGAPMDMPAGAPSEDAGAPASEPTAPAQPGAPSQPAPSPAGKAPKSASHAGSSASAPQNAKSASTDKPKSQSRSLILYTGDVAMTVDADAKASTMDSIVDVAETFGGHLAGRAQDTVKVKIPSDRFREAVQKIGKLGDVTSENVNADDVTAEYHDLEVRIENLKATRKRLEEFLAKAGTINDMLTVERELERVAKEMDTIVGRLRFLREHTAFSVLTVRVTARPKAPPPVVATTTTTALPRAIDLPVSWFASLGVDKLLSLPSKK